VKILFWSGYFPPYIGGLEVFSLELLHGLRQRGHEVMVISTQSGIDVPEFGMYQGIPVYRFNFTRVLYNRNMTEMSRLLRRIRDLKRSFAPDVIHMNDNSFSLFFHQATPYPCPTVWTIHGPFPYDEIQTNSLNARMLQEVSRVVAVSQAVYRYIITFSAVSPRILVLLNGLTMPSLKPTPLPYDPPHFLCAGRLVADKGFDLALEAFASLLPRFPALRLTIVGDGPARSDLEAQAQQLRIGHAARFAGWVAPEEIPAVINTATAVVVPSRWQEPFGLVALQAGQMARPALVTRVGGLPEIIVDGETGWVVEPADSAALADAMCAVLENPAEATRRGTAARERASQHFSGTRMVDDYERLFAQVTSEATS
jgi:glycosyltransferase involved in cell wall biosynthesis